MSSPFFPSELEMMILFIRCTIFGKGYVYMTYNMLSFLFSRELCVRVGAGYPIGIYRVQLWGLPIICRWANTCRMEVATGHCRFLCGMGIPTRLSGDVYSVCSLHNNSPCQQVMFLKFKRLLSFRESTHPLMAIISLAVCDPSLPRVGHIRASHSRQTVTAISQVNC